MAIIVKRNKINLKGKMVSIGMDMHKRCLTESKVSPF